MITVITVVHVFVCVFLILVILLQAGKGGGMGSLGGGAGSQTVFGGRGAQTFLGKVTSVSAAIFMLTSLSLAWNSTHSRSVMDRHELPAQAPVAPPAGTTAPAAPAAPAPASQK